MEAGNSIEEGNLAGLENSLQLGQIKASKGPLNADKGQILLFHQGLHAVIGRTFQQNLFPLAAKIHLREDIEGLLGTCCDDQLVPAAIDIVVHEQLMAGGNQVLQTLLLVVVVEEVIFTANQALIEANPKIFVGELLEISRVEVKHLLLKILVLQDIVATFFHGIDGILVLELQHGLLDRILAALVFLAEFADGGQLLTSLKVPLLDTRQDILDDGFVLIHLFFFQHKAHPDAVHGPE